MAIFNQYSAVWIAVFLVVIAGIILIRRKPRWPTLAGFGALLIGLAVAWYLLHPSQTAQFNDPSQVQATIGKGTPVLLEFQSPY